MPVLPPLYAHAQVRLVVPGVFVASVALTASGCWEPLRVRVDSHDNTSTTDAWGTPKHQVRAVVQWWCCLQWWCYFYGLIPGVNN